MTICTVVDKNYIEYVPLFVYCARKAYPSYDIKVFCRDSAYGWILNYLYEWDILDGVQWGRFMGYPNNDATTPSLRFVLPDGWVDQERPVLITDVDIMIYKEKVSIYDLHVRLCKIHDNCYDNILMRGKPDKMSGVHFVLPEWWERTREARGKYRELLKSPTAALKKDDDEYMLAAMHRGAGLKDPPIGSDEHRIHGIHLGTIRARPNKPYKMTQQHQVDFVKSLKEDNYFNNMLRFCRKLNPDIDRSFTCLYGKVK